MDYDKDCNLEFDIFINIRMEQQRQQKEYPKPGCSWSMFAKGVTWIGDPEEPWTI